MITTPNVFVELKATITEFQAKMGEARAELDATKKKSEDSFAGMGKFSAAAFAAIGAGAIAVGVEAIHLADAFEVSHARLTASLTANGQSFDAWKGQINAADQAGEKLGFTNTQVEDGLARLETIVKNPAVALRDLAVAEDIARARGMDLTSAANLVGKASEGTYTALVRLGVVTKDQAASFHSGAEAVNFLGQAFGGQASAYADTFAGKMQVLKATGEDLGKNLGLLLIPIIEKVATAFGDGVRFIEDHKTGLAELAKVITAVVVPAFGMWLVAQSSVIAAGIADWIINVVTGLTAMATAVGTTATQLYLMGTAADSALGPIGLLIGGIAALAMSSNSTWNDITDAQKIWATSFVQGLGAGVDKVKALQAEENILSQRADELAKAMTGSGAASNAAAAAYDDNGKKLKLIDDALKSAQLQAKGFTDGQRAAQQATDAANKADEVAANTKKVLAQAVKDTTQAVKDTTKATNDYFNAAVTADQVDIAWTQNINNLKVAIKQNGDVLDVNTIAGANNRQVIDNLVTATDKQIEATIAAGGSAQDQQSKIQGYVDKLDAAFKSAGLTAGQIKALNAQYNLTPTDITTQINVNVAAAEASLAALAAQAQKAFSASGGSAGIIGGSYSLPPGKAAGGPVAADQPYIVGENGPELFIPNLGGTVVNDARIQAALTGLTGSDYATQVIRQVVGQAALTTRALSASAASVPMPGGGSASANAQLGQQMAAVRGWNGIQWADLNNVAMRESGWNQYARNASSGAYGIAQALPPTKYPFAGQAAGGSDPGVQIAWMLNYIAGRYGNPAGAWAHEVSAGWYDQGGWLQPGLTMAFNNTGRAERVSPPGGDGAVQVNIRMGDVYGPGGLTTVAETIRTELMRLGRGWVA